MDIYNEIPAVELSEVARLARADEDRILNRLILARWFPAQDQQEITYSRSTGTDRTFSETALFRAFDEPPRLGTRPGVTRVEGELPPLSIEYDLSEYDKLRHRQANATANAQIRDLLEPVVVKDVARGVAAVERRFEWVRRDLLWTGTATLADGGLNLTMDVERDPARSSTVVVGWDVPATAVPFDDERGVVDTMVDDEDIMPQDLVAMMNPTTWRAWKACQQVIDLADPIAAAIGNSIAQLTDSAAQQVRRDHELPPAVINWSRAQNPDTGLTERIIPDWVVLYLPNFEIGRTAYGVPAIANEDDLNIPFEQRPGPVAYLTRTLKPLVTSTVIDALGVPILDDPDATYALTVKP